MINKNNDTKKLIEKSKNISDDIAKEFLDVFGIELDTNTFEHHDKTRPLWTQQIRDNKSLKLELDEFLGIVRQNVNRLPQMIQFENEHPDVIQDKYSAESVSFDLEFLWICQSHVEKFQKDKYLKPQEITKYITEIENLRDTIKRITIDASLKSTG